MTPPGPIRPYRRRPFPPRFRQGAKNSALRVCLRVGFVLADKGSPNRDDPGRASDFMTCAESRAAESFRIRSIRRSGRSSRGPCGAFSGRRRRPPRRPRVSGYPRYSWRALLIRGRRRARSGARSAPRSRQCRIATIRRTGTICGRVPGEWRRRPPHRAYTAG